MKRLLLIFSLVLCRLSPAAETSYDVLVYGGTPSGVAAAVNAGRDGCRVVLVEETYQVGGLTAGGLGHTDFKTFESLGGSWKEFMDGVQEHYRTTYGENSAQHRDCSRGGYYEPKVARKVFEEMLASAKVTVMVRHQIVAAEKEGERVVAATFVPADSSKGYPLPKPGTAQIEVRAKVFIDATYEGDLLAKAGVPCRLGTEGREEFGESFAPEEGSDRIMATNFRVCLSRDPNNMRPMPRPADYDRERYAKVVELIREGKVTPKEMGGAPWPLDHLIRARPIPNLKSDFNDTSGSLVSIKLIEETHAWPEADAAGRAALFDLAKIRTLGMFWFLGNDPELPTWVRDGMNRWGLPLDEFVEYDNWTPVLYLREGRRLKGLKVFTQNDTKPDEEKGRSPLRTDAVAMGNYSISSHGTHHREDGSIAGVLANKVKPFQVPYGCLVPETAQGLLASVPVSASHVGYGAIRMEPTWTAIGQAAGTAAALAVKSNIELRDVPVRALQKKLHEKGAFTVYLSDVPAVSPYFRAAQFFGTHGFFHELDDSGTAPGFFEGPPVKTANQWSSKPVAGHALLPEEPLAPELAVSWQARFAEMFPERAAEAAKIRTRGGVTRGEFLKGLFELVP